MLAFFFLLLKENLFVSSFFFENFDGNIVGFLAAPAVFLCSVLCQVMVGH